MRHHDFAGHDFVQQLPFQLRKRVAIQVHERKLRQVPLFAEVEGRFLAALATYLIPEVYLPEEYILVARVSLLMRGTSQLMAQSGVRTARSWRVPAAK